MIRAEGDTVFYTGLIGPDSGGAFLASVESAAGLRRLVINSGGGDTIAARIIGRWVAEHQLDVEVVGGCFSSCANYIFVAGRNKVINKNAFVGWHGSEFQYDAVAVSTPQKTAAELLEEEVREAMAAAIADGEMPDEADVAEQVARLLASRAEEAEFFRDIGIDIELTVYGHHPKNLPVIEASGKDGWTYSVADMARFGVTDVLYLGPGRYQDSTSVQKYLVVLPVHADCCKIPEKSRK